MLHTSWRCYQSSTQWLTQCFSRRRSAARKALNTHDYESVQSWRRDNHEPGDRAQYWIIRSYDLISTRACRQSCASGGALSGTNGITQLNRRVLASWTQSVQVHNEMDSRLSQFNPRSNRPGVGRAGSARSAYDDGPPRPPPRSPPLHARPSGPGGKSHENCTGCRRI